MIRSTSCPWAWTQSSRSTPTSPMHNLSFTSCIRWSCMVENYLVKYQKGMACENLWVHTVFREGIGSIHRGILETYTTSFKSKYHQLESRAWLAKSENKIYQWHYVSGKELPKWLNMKGDVGQNPTKDLSVHNEADASIGTLPEEEGTKGHRTIKTTE